MLLRWIVRQGKGDYQSINEDINCLKGETEGFNKQDPLISCWIPSFFCIPITKLPHRQRNGMCLLGQLPGYARQKSDIRLGFQIFVVTIYVCYGSRHLCCSFADIVDSDRPRAV